MNNNYKCYNLQPDEESMVLEQIKYLHGEYISIQQYFVGIISVALTGYAIIIYYALNSDNKEFFFVLPFLFSLSVYNILKYTIRALGLNAYIRHLEKLINTKHQKSLFLWQSYLVYANGYSVLGAFPQIPCFLAMGIFFGYKFCDAISSTTYPFCLILLLIILLIIQVMFLVLMSVNCITQYWAVLDICQTMPPTLITDEDIHKLTKIKPQQIYYAKMFSLFISKYKHQTRKNFFQKSNQYNNKSKPI